MTSGGRVTESTVDEAALAWLDAGGWRVTHVLEIAPESTRTPSSSREATWVGGRPYGLAC